MSLSVTTTIDKSSNKQAIFPNHNIIPYGTFKFSASSFLIYNIYGVFNSYYKLL